MEKIVVTPLPDKMLLNGSQALHGGFPHIVTSNSLIDSFLMVQTADIARKGVGSIRQEAQLKRIAVDVPEGLEDDVFQTLWRAAGFRNPSDVTEANVRFVFDAFLKGDKIEEKEPQVTTETVVSMKLAHDAEVAALKAELEEAKAAKAEVKPAKAKAEVKPAKEEVKDSTSVPAPTPQG